MRPVSRLVFCLAALLALAACADPKHYPISGEACGPEDPVLDVDATMGSCAGNI